MNAPTREQMLGWPPTVPLWPEAAGALGVGRTLIYELASRDELPVRVLRLGRVMRVPTGDLLELLGIGPAEPAETPPRLRRLHGLGSEGGDAA